MAKRGYHHGDLRRALLDAAAAAIEESGPGALSLRELARRAGVSHAAPTHHFGDKAGLLTALAAEGYHELAAELAAARDETGSFLEVGVAYVRFAVAHRAHFEVMFRPDLYHPDDPDLAAARARADRALYTGITDLRDGTLFARTAKAQEKAQAAESAEAAKPAESAEAAKPAESAEAAKPAESAEAAKPAESADQADPIPPTVREAGLAAWSLAHGFATLWLSGALRDAGNSAADAARVVLRQLNPDAPPL